MGARPVRAAAALATLAAGITLLLNGESGARHRVGNLEVVAISHVSRSAVVRLITRRRVVALSFDDGPDPRFTPAALRIIRDFGAHATFFAVGRSAVAHRALIRAELRAGNEVQNHTWDHADLRRLGAGAAEAEVARGRAALRAAGAPAPTLFRAPYGNFTAAGSRQAERDHELMVGWTFTVERALDGRSPAHAVAWMVRRLRPGAIILAHDGRLDRSRTLVALPLLLRALHARGYGVVSVSSLLGIGGAETRAAARQLGGAL